MYQLHSIIDNEELSFESAYLFLRVSMLVEVLKDCLQFVGMRYSDVFEKIAVAEILWNVFLLVSIEDYEWW